MIRCLAWKRGVTSQYTKHIETCVIWIIKSNKIQQESGKRIELIQAALFCHVPWIVRRHHAWPESNKTHQESGKTIELNLQINQNFCCILWFFGLMLTKNRPIHARFRFIIESASEQQCCQCSVHWISSDTSRRKNATEFCISFPSRPRDRALHVDFFVIDHLNFSKIHRIENSDAFSAFDFNRQIRVQNIRHEYICARFQFQTER